MNLRSRIKKTFLVTIQILAVLQIIMILLNVPFGFIHIVKDGNYIRTGSIPYLEYAFTTVICLLSLYFAITAKTSMKIKAPFLAINILPLFISILQSFHYTLSFMYISVLAAIIILYINIQVDMGHRIEEFKNKVMISQIQPHFMYNTLTTIKALCRVEPELAAKTITNFADYLRGNMDFASLNTTIPFEIPALTVQPMVENAVRHGVRSKPDGHILIHTFQKL